VQIGDIVEGQIKSIEKYGIFVTNYWGDGLLHRTNISTHYWDKEKLMTYFKSGDKITTKVISIDDEKIGLSLKELIDTPEEDKYFDFINYVDYGDVFIKENYNLVSQDILNEDIEIRYNQLEKAFCFEQFAILKRNLDDKIHFLRLSKQFFSSINNPRSYLINIYTNYFELLKLIEGVINSFSFEKLDIVKVEAQKILEKVKSQEQTLDVYPDAKKLIFFINIISLFNDTTEDGINALYELLKKNSDKVILTTITKITLANNLLISVSEEYSDFVRKNLSHIKSYLDEGVLSLKETESDKRQRELKEKVKYWSRRILEDENETQEFKSTFITPRPDERKLKEKEKLLSILSTAKKKDGILMKIDAIDGKLASKAVIHSSLKTLCAFANTNGGTLLIGIDDNKSTVGLEVDYVNLKGKKNRDGFGLFFDEKVKEYFEPSFSSLLVRDFLKFPDGDILIVSVKQSVEPVFLLKDKVGKSSEELFIRDLTSTKEIVEKRDLVKFVKQKEKEQLKIKIDV
jgi:predicted RNA-binding protein with RPS1 domain